MKSVILTAGLNQIAAPVQIREEIPAARCIRELAKDSPLFGFDPSVFHELHPNSTNNRIVNWPVADEVDPMVIAELKTGGPFGGSSLSTAHTFESVQR